MPPMGVTGPRKEKLLPKAFANDMMYRDPENKMMPKAKNRAVGTAFFSLPMSPSKSVINMTSTCTR